MAALLTLCIFGIFASAALAALGPAGSWEPARWAGEKFWELVLILTGGKLALVTGKLTPNGHPPEPAPVSPSGPSLG